MLVCHFDVMLAATQMLPLRSEASAPGVLITAKHEQLQPPSVTAALADLLPGLHWPSVIRFYQLALPLLPDSNSATWQLVQSLQHALQCDLQSQHAGGGLLDDVAGLTPLPDVQKLFAQSVTELKDLELRLASAVAAGAGGPSPMLSGIGQQSGSSADGTATVAAGATAASGGSESAAAAVVEAAPEAPKVALSLHDESSFRMLSTGLALHLCAEVCPDVGSIPEPKVQTAALLLLQSRPRRAAAIAAAAKLTESNLRGWAPFTTGRPVICLVETTARSPAMLGDLTLAKIALTQR